VDPILAKIKPPSLVYYNTIDEYRAHYIKKYAHGLIKTFDGITVLFNIFRFEHAFFKASIPDAAYKDLFDRDRAERIDWIEYALCSGLSEVYIKSDNGTKRLHILLDQYIVVLRMDEEESKTARFVTAYIADSEAHIKKLKSNKLRYMPK